MPDLVHDHDASRQQRDGDDDREKGAIGSGTDEDPLGHTGSLTREGKSRSDRVSCPRHKLRAEELDPDPDDLERDDREHPEAELLLALLNLILVAALSGVEIAEHGEKCAQDAPPDRLGMDMHESGDTHPDEKHPEIFDTPVDGVVQLFLVDGVMGLGDDALEVLGSKTRHERRCRDAHEGASPSFDQVDGRRQPPGHELQDEVGRKRSEEHEQSSEYQHAAREVRTASDLHEIFEEIRVDGRVLSGDSRVANVEHAQDEHRDTGHDVPDEEGCDARTPHLVPPRPGRRRGGRSYGRRHI